MTVMPSGIPCVLIDLRICFFICQPQYCCSCYTGFPGETDEAHQEVVNFVKGYILEQSGAFACSEEDELQRWDCLSSYHYVSGRYVRQMSCGPWVDKQRNSM